MRRLGTVITTSSRMLPTLRRAVLVMGFFGVSTSVAAQTPAVSQKSASKSFWYRLSGDDGLPDTTMAVVDFSVKGWPVVRVNPTRSSDQELEIVRRAMIVVFRDHRDAFPDGKLLLVLPRPRSVFAPDTASAEANARAVLSPRRKQLLAKKKDGSTPSGYLVLVVDKRP